MDPAPTRAYLDNNATTPVAREVLEAMLPWFRDEPGNPSSLHASGERAHAALSEARGRVARLVGGRPDSLTFTSGATEATNLAVHLALDRATAPRPRVVTSAVEHPATAECLDGLGEAVDLVTIGVDATGGLDLDHLLAALTPGTALCSLLLVNNETGRVIEPETLAAVAARCSELELPLHLAAVQAAGKLPLDLVACGAQLASFSAHKLHGPKGVGALWIAPGFLPDEPRALLRGGPQERGLRAGTENLAGIVGFGKAAELARAWLAGEGGGAAGLAARRDRLEAGLTEALSDCAVAAAEGPRAPGTACIEFHGVDGEAALLMLSHHGIEVSTGSACGSSHHAPSHVLLAMGRSEAQAASSLRFSLSRETTDAEVESALSTVPSVIEALRALAPG